MRTYQRDLEKAEPMQTDDNDIPTLDLEKGEPTKSDDSHVPPQKPLQAHFQERPQEHPQDRPQERLQSTPSSSNQHGPTRGLLKPWQVLVILVLFFTPFLTVGILRSFFKDLLNDNLSLRAWADFTFVACMLFALRVIIQSTISGKCERRENLLFYRVV